MLARVKKSAMTGEVWIPGSKSHMIRALYFGALGRGKSIIRNPVRSKDSLSAAGIIRALGVPLDMSRDDYWTVEGGKLSLPEDVLDVGNSGTSMYMGSAMLASLNGRCVVTGDEQIRRRPAQPVLNALMLLGAEAFTLRGNGSAPFMVRGPLKGGKTFVDGIVSQYVSTTILAATLAEKDSEIMVDRANEIPYIEMTLQWMRSLGVEVDVQEDFNRYFVKSGQTYANFDKPVPADFSSGAFMLIGSAVTDSSVTLRGLDTQDVQGDKILIDVLKDMGADIEVLNHGLDGIRVNGGRKLQGRVIDCSPTPDSVPILSVLGCFAEGETRLINIESSRLKETDRPLMMQKELAKMGGSLELTEKELIIRHSRLQGCAVNSYADHRIAMAMCIAGLIADGTTLVDRVESAAISYPGFDTSLASLGAEVEYLEDGVEA
ncbi:MAG: 3-phosphoshikimate 1-carboxyvinyltransferase [Spirochaetales bacterium]|nr:3-phosphoshikimate 1-carboxyvinyltransferase [Spirochaetales bacterium]